LEEASEQPAKKAKKAEIDKAAKATGSGLSTIQEEPEVVRKLYLHHLNQLNLPFLERKENPL